jgi:HSP20 family molecular chaperone IbpA
MTNTATAIEEKDAPERRRVFVPAADIYEQNEVTYIVADMPGVSPDGLDIELDKDVLTIKGRTAPATTQESTLYSEYERGDYERAFRIRSEVDRDSIKASLRHGVLTVALPRGKQAQARKIAVEQE